MTFAYYNEFEPRMADWLRELMAEGLIPHGDVDERSIRDVEPTDLRGYTQLHFFAGCGGWPRALRLYGWRDDRPVITGSPPCQPFSCAGEGKGTHDARHLFPIFCRIVAECHDLYGFTEVFGEQVASALGREWIARVRASFEGLGFAVGGTDTCIPCVGGPNIRQRLYWFAKRVAESKSQQFDREMRSRGGWSGYPDHGSGSRLADSSSVPGAELRAESRERAGGQSQHAPEHRDAGERLADSDVDGCGAPRTSGPECEGPDVESRGGTNGLGNSVDTRLEGHAGNGDDGHQSRRLGTSAPRSTAEASTVGRMEEPNGGRLEAWSGGESKGSKSEGGDRLSEQRSSAERMANSECPERQTDDQHGQLPARRLEDAGGHCGSSANGFWSDSIWWQCRDGKRRRIPNPERVLFGLAHGVSDDLDIMRAARGFPLAGKIKGRTTLLKGYGNAINPELAAEFIACCMQALDDLKQTK